MGKLTTLTAVAVLALTVPWSAANAGKGSDFALFDGTNPLNTDPGALCGAGEPDKLKAKSFTYYIAVTNEDVANREIRVIYTDGDFVRYKVPQNQSFSLAQAGGSGEFDVAIRVDADDDISGSVSINGKGKVFCLSCDEDSDGDVGCDAVIGN